MATTAAQLMVKCLGNEGVEFIFGVPGEVVDAARTTPPALRSGPFLGEEGRGRR